MPGRSVIRSFSVSSGTMRLAASPSSLEQGAGVAVHQAGLSSRQVGVTLKQSASQALGSKGAQAGLAAGMLQVEGAAAAPRRWRKVDPGDAAGCLPARGSAIHNPGWRAHENPGWAGRPGTTRPSVRCAGVPLPLRQFSQSFNRKNQSSSLGGDDLQGRYRVRRGVMLR